ncbi:hypothetical protein K469DRAFT_741531 [Zopfia rhizophila CBS 207.26]|uniref:Oxidase ustYa n=1 Tax=Zopfia rhizophila CBS 207.26 TaxID=1314779 RepID=A0A6A6DL87_9PEZI|nr:hypothetical protein K469DRAFT_741531 [Zopfia rhizophila CBS 207.26]
MDPANRDFEADEEEESFLPQSQSAEHDETPSTNRRPVTWYLRILLELIMASTIAFLVFFRPSTSPSIIRKSPVPQFPKKIYTFHNDPHYAREDMFFNESTTLHTLHNWIPLSSASRGYIVLGDKAQNFDLPNPYNVAVDRYTEGPGYMMSVFHQLHCLSYLAEHFQQGYGGIELEDEVAHHSAHCFNYLRQGIMCAGDTTLEGETDAGPGEGSVHECVDYDAVLEWANGHSAYRWREGLLPGTSIL